MKSKVSTPWGRYKLQIDKKYDELAAVANLQAEQIDELFQAVDILLERNDYLKEKVSVLTQEIKDKRHIPPQEVARVKTSQEPEELVATEPIERNTEPLSKPEEGPILEDERVEPLKQRFIKEVEEVAVTLFDMTAKDYRELIPEISPLIHDFCLNYVGIHRASKRPALDHDAEKCLWEKIENELLVDKFDRREDAA